MHIYVGFGCKYCKFINDSSSEKIVNEKLTECNHVDTFDPHHLLPVSLRAITLTKVSRNNMMKYTIHMCFWFSWPCTAVPERANRHGATRILFPSPLLLAPSFIVGHDSCNGVLSKNFDSVLSSKLNSYLGFCNGRCCILLSKLA